MQIYSKNRKNGDKIIFLSTYPPRQCGLATFTYDLSIAVRRAMPSIDVGIIAVDNEVSKKYKYPSEVVGRIYFKDVDDYIEAARAINNDPSIKVVSIQHEFGIYGRKDINYLSAFLENIKKPVVVTMHTLVKEPSVYSRSVIQYIIEKSSVAVFQVKSALDILSYDYGIKSKKVKIIRHGVPVSLYESGLKQKEKLGLQGRRVLSSFGLISSGKAYEFIVMALPKVVKKFPNVLYLIIGATHPGVKMKEGEKYRNFLKAEVKRLGLEDNVRFVNRYLTLDELIEYLKATDIYVSSGLGLKQIVSGTLSYAMSVGRPVISHPFVHAVEALADGRGILVRLKDSNSYARAINLLLGDEALRHKMGKEAYKYASKFTWPKVGQDYAKIFKKLSKN